MKPPRRRSRLAGRFDRTRVIAWSRRLAAALTYKAITMASRLALEHELTGALDLCRGARVEPGVLVVVIADSGHMTLGPRSFIRRGVSLKLQGALTIGADSYVAEYASINVMSAVTIGDRVLIASHASVADHDHGTVAPAGPGHSWPLRLGPVLIEDDVFIGPGARICRGARVGRGSIIGANAVVTDSLPPMSVVYAR
jgi:carbonic anhydrase/acetyltransferase-like protein (isoleucine patch superfamily)